MAYNPSEGSHPIIQQSSSRPPSSSRISFVSDISSPDLYDPEIRRQESRGFFVSPQASLSDLQSHRYNLPPRHDDLPHRDDSDVSHVQVHAVPGSPLDQPRPFSATFVPRLESQPRGPPQSPSASSNRQRYSWDRYEPLSPVDSSRANTGLTGRLRSIRSIGSGVTRHLSRHLSIPENEEMDMGLLRNAYSFGRGETAYHSVDEENEHGEELGLLGVDISNFLGPDSPHDAATVLKYRQLESDGHLTGGLGSGLKPDITIRSKDLLATASPTSPLEISRGLSRRMSRRTSKKGVLLDRTFTRHDLGQREANKTGKIIEVLVEDGGESSASVDLSVYAGEGTPPVEFDPLRDRQPTLKVAKEIYYPQPNWKPHSMRWPYLTALITVSITLSVAQEFIYRRSRSLASQSPPSGLFEFTNAQDLGDWDFFSFKYLPTIIAVTYGILWQITDYEVKRLEPFHRLSREGGALASESINIDYITIFNILRPFRALRYRHYAVAVSSFATILAVSIVPTLQTASIILEPDRVTRDQNPSVPKFINIDATCSRVLTGILGLISILGIILLILLQNRRSGLAGDVRGIAGIAAMATKSHVLMDFKDLDTVPPRDIHNKLKNRRYTLRNSSLASDAVPMRSGDEDKYDRFRLSANPHPLMLRLIAGGPFIVSMIAFTIFIPLVIFSPANIILDRAGWLLTFLAVAIKIGFQTLEQDARLMEPFYRLSCRHASPKVLTLDYTSMAFGYMPIRAAINGDSLIALVGVGTVLAEILTVCVVSVAAVNTDFSPALMDSTTQSSSETPKSFWISFGLSILILLYLIIIASFVYKLRRHPFLPRQPSTIASVLAFIHQSKMLYDFVAVPAPSSRPPLPATTSPETPITAGASRTGSVTSNASNDPTSPPPPPPPLRRGVELHAAQTLEDQDLLVKRLIDMGKTYGLGWFIGRDGDVHCGVDQEELKMGYKHKKGEDARQATITGVGGWDYL
jgi:hypothetical protein